ncbi:Release factor H-coupled R [Mycena indigotica]|uniref:3'-phosphate/5'-hydroxy nucleic acid ligase n=1 Tax=Mycena indigotica TaxID=2126181 RepID=A0A8H6SBM6_9AGAR|nr:Release factor H-coupled R [Mycena indigotica]KAF7294865.1 Release factor H-coupled R [Mycena indigotica]
MPSRALTVILNADNNKRFALLLSTSDNARARILRDAQNKFRIRGLSVVFLPGGEPLKKESELPELVTQVFVAKAEPYSGPAVSQSKARIDGPAELRLIGEKSFIDDAAIAQLKAIGQLPGIVLTVGLPDLHPGSRFPIGCSIAAEGVYPALIGSDVGCGIALYEVNARPKSTPNPSKLASTLRSLEEPWEGSVSSWLADYGITHQSSFDISSLGTVGAGNHFAELCVVDKITEDGQLDIVEGGLYLLVHTGSRGLGSSTLAAETTSDSNPYIPPDSPHLASYLEQHDYCVAWARANRDLVAYRIMQCIMPSNEPTKPRKLVDVTHNSVTKHRITVGATTKELWVHRKGAAPADQGIAPCPGSRGHHSWLLRPTGDGQHNAFSLAHGAGRRFGRNTMHTGAKTSKANLTQTALGSVVVCEDPALLIEEQPDAYKDVDGEHFRHRLNQQQASRVSSFSTAPTLPRNLLSDAVYSQDKPNRPRTTREALFVCKPADPDEGVFTPISEEQRILVLSLVLDMDIRPPRVPRLTLLCLQSLVVSCSDEELSELVSSYIPAHLRLDLMRHTAVSNPLTTGQLKALCSDGSVSGELIVVGPFAQLTEGGLQGARHDSHNEDWDDEDSTLPLPMRTLLLISTPLSLSFVLALPPTLSKLALNA